MSINHNLDLIRYEYIAYINVLDIDNVKEIGITRAELDDMISNSDRIKWSPVKNLNIDSIDTVNDIRNDNKVSSRKAMNRICGLFDAEPLDWKYARILVDNKASTKNNFAVAKLPRSPITPIVLEINE